MEIVRTQTYAKGLKRLRKLGASYADVETMELSIASDPRSGDTISGTGGLRKMRFAYAQAGKRGGGRTIYYAWASRGDGDPDHSLPESGQGRSHGGRKEDVR